MLLLLLSGGQQAGIPVVEGAPGNVAPYTPSIVSVGQASGVVVVGALENANAGAFPVVFLNLYKATSRTGPWTYVCSQSVAKVALETFLIDNAPNIGTTEWYCVTAVDTAGQESAQCAPLFYTTLTAPSVGVGLISPSAFGQNPVLGSDIFISPRTGEGVVGKNGDFLLVNGLPLLAQDLRLRIMARRGSLTMHQDYGLKTTVIGSGQARPGVQAQMLAADIHDTIAADPRVAQVLDVTVAQYDAYSWVVSFTVMAIGSEDPLMTNMVLPYFLASAA